jgi:O-antigen/teichoic acid export membrane protein
MTALLRRNAMWQLLQTVFGTGTELLIVLVLAAWLAPREFGAFVVAASSCKIVFLMLEPRMHEFLTPRLARYLGRSNLGTWAWVRWATAAEGLCNAVALAACILALPNLPYLQEQVGFALLASAAAYTAGNTFLKFSTISILRCLSQVRVAAMFSVVGSAAKLALLGASLWAATSLPRILLGLSLVAAVLAAVQALFAYASLKAASGPAAFRTPRPLRAQHLRDMHRTLGSNYGTGLVEMVHREFDVQICAALAGPVEAGRYRLAKTLASVTLEALSPVVLVLLPEFSRQVAAGAWQELRVLVRRLSWAMAAAGLLAASLVLAATYLYLKFVVPEQVAAWWPALCLVLSFAGVAPGLWAQAYLVAVGRAQIYFTSSGLGAALAIGVAFVLAGRFGATGSAIAFGMGLAVTTGLASRVAVRHARDMAATPRNAGGG